MLSCEGYSQVKISKCLQERHEVKIAQSTVEDIIRADVSL